MQRVMITGQPGSGKSTLAIKLGERTGLPVVHIDKIHWKSGWIEREADEKLHLTLEAHARDAWIIEGGFSATWPDRLARADTLIWLDVPLLLRFWRVVRRTIRYHGQSRPDLPEGCPEGFHGETIEFWKWIWDTRHTGRQKLKTLYESVPGEKNAIRLTTLRETETFLDQVTAR